METIIIKGKTIKVEFGHTKKEWKSTFSGDSNLWDFSFEDLVTGAIEPDEDIVYWYIDGRFYETDNNKFVESDENEKRQISQLNEIKAKYPDATILFRFGDYYQAYRDDARIMADICKEFGNMGDDGVMRFSFPKHRLDSILPKLIRFGLRVAICD